MKIKRNQETKGELKEKKDQATEAEVLAAKFAGWVVEEGTKKWKPPGMV